MSTDPSHQKGELVRLSAGGLDSSALSLDMMQETDGSATPTEMSVSSALFFADATLDLSEAHDMAETPEPQRLPMEAAARLQAPGLMEMPNLTPLTTMMEPTTFSNATAGSEHKTNSSDSTMPTRNLTSRARTARREPKKPTKGYRAVAADGEEDAPEY